MICISVRNSAVRRWGIVCTLGRRVAYGSASCTRATYIEVICDRAFCIRAIYDRESAIREYGIRVSGIRYQTVLSRNLRRGNSWGRQGACRLLIVGALVSEEVDNLDIADAIDRITADEPATSQVGEQSFNIAIIRWQDVPFDLAGAVIQPALPIRQTPQPREQKPAQRSDLHKLFIAKKPRLDVTCPHWRVRSLCPLPSLSA